MMKAVIIGGVAAGLSAASKLKRVMPNAEIIVYEKGHAISYGACGLPYYMSGVNPDISKLFIRSKEKFEEQGIFVETGQEVVQVLPHEKLVMVKDTSTGRIKRESYDKLLVASGAAAIRPGVPGIELAGVYTLKNMQDAIALKLEMEKAKNIVVVGGGFIGIEAAETLREAGKEVRLIEAAPHILAPFDKEIRDILETRMIEAGIKLHRNERLEELIPNTGIGMDTSRVGGVRTSGGEYTADIVILALGIRPETGFLAGTGIRRAKNGAIEVDRKMQTSLPDVYAAGDCASIYNRITGKSTYQPLGTTANKCGRLAGENMAGGNREFSGCVGSMAILVSGMEAGRTGLNEQEARELFGEVSLSFVKTGDRPGYYPGRTDIWIKLICEKKTGRILGGQSVGEKGAVLRVNTIALAVTNGFTAEELGMTDFCYAPPFSEVWDALNIAGNAVK